LNIAAILLVNDVLREIQRLLLW